MRIKFKKCLTGNVLAWIDDGQNIISNGVSKKDAVDNLKIMYKALVDYYFVFSFE